MGVMILDEQLLRMFVYGNSEKYSVLKDVLSAHLKSESDKSAALGHIDRAVKEILCLSEQFGFCGNLWKCFLSYLLIEDENPYTLSLEMRKEGESPVKSVAVSDLRKMYKLFFYDFKPLEKCLGERFFSYFENTDFSDEKIGGRNNIGRIVSAFAKSLNQAENEEDFISVTEAFYRANGVGKFAFSKAFRLAEGADFAQVIPIYDMKDVGFNDLWGYEYQKSRIIANTQGFVNSKQANNVLLYGDAGTGKSTMIKAVLNEFYSSGLRMVEVYKHQFKQLSSLIQQMKSRNYYFIIYMDDLSFEDFEIEYKYLKAVIEGGLEEKPKNILIYATSNRRHLIKETWNDRSDMDSDLHRSDTMSEKLSLADRFGLSINFSKPNQNDYFSIVTHLARKNSIDMDEKMLLDGARQWELSNSGRSGRTAQQYINHLLSSK